MKVALIIAKVAITLALAWIILERVDLAPVGSFITSSRATAAMILCVGVLIGQAFMAALRLRWIMRLMGTHLPLSTGFSTWMSGLLVSQATFIAGDATRIWQLVQRGHGRRLSAGAIFLERALGFAVLMAMVLVSLPFLLARDMDAAVRAGLWTLGGLCGVGILGFVASAFVNRIIARVAPRLHAQRIASAITDITSAARHLASSWKLTIAVILINVIMHLCNALVFYILGLAADVNLSMANTVIVALPVMLMALMPIALAGWGVREGAAVVGYGLFGIGAQTATTLSITFGLVLLLTSLPGGIFLWAGKKVAAEDRERQLVEQI